MIVKNLNFGGTAREQVFKGIEKLTNAVSSTLGASGKCVILEDASGNPIITKDVRYRSKSGSCFITEIRRE